MKRIINKNLSILGLALTFILLLSRLDSQVTGQSISRGVGNIVGSATGAIDGALPSSNSGGDVGNKPQSGASGNFSTEFHGSLGLNNDATASPNGDNNGGQAAPRSGADEQPTTTKPENFFNKMKDMFSGGSASTPAPPQQQQNGNSTPSSVAQNFTEAMRSSDTSSSGNTSTTTSRPEGSLSSKLADFSRSAKESYNHTVEAMHNGTSRNGNDTSNRSEDGLGSKLSRALNKGGEMLKDTGNKIDEKMGEMGEKARNFTSRVDNAIHNATSHDEGSNNSNNNKNMTQSMKEYMNNNKSREEQSKEEGRSGVKDEDSKNIMVELFDKAHELSKMPMESVLRPLDKMLGVEKDPLLKMMDSSHNVLRKPLDMLTKPMGSVLDGAFRTSDELENEDPNKPVQKKKDNEFKSNHKKGDRSLVGEIADKAVELAESPLELVLKPLDKILGNSDKKNPLIRLLDEVYSISKKPVDKLAKPFEDVLRKMANGYQESTEYSDLEDPKLVTRLADGALNVADRVFTKPIELATRPLNRILGYDDKNKKNSIVEAAHAWKNATRLGLELLTKPIDRIIKEIADLGDIKDEEEREEEYKRRREEASRLVEFLDKIHDAAQTPFEIVLRPVNKILGSKKKNHKQPVLRAWDLLHYVLRVPIQVVSKPVEDALLGEREKKQNRGGKRGGGAYASATASSRGGLLKKDRKKGDDKKNLFVDNIKKAEKMVIKPLELLSLPMRKLILGHEKKDNKRHHNGSHGSNAKGNESNSSESSNHNDKITKTLEKMNNVMLTPIELLTQPIADTLFSKKGGELKMDAKVNFIPNNSTSTTTSTTTTRPPHKASSTTSTPTTTQSPQNSSSSNNNKKDDNQQGFNATASSSMQGQVSKG